MIIIYFILGLCVGSFLNVFIFRVRQGKSVLRGRSRCPRCQKTLNWRELIPLASFLIQRGRCLGCKKKIDWQYPLVELATGLLFMLILSKYSIFDFSFLQSFNLLIFLFIISVLVFLFVYDLRFGELPDQITLPAIVILLIFYFLNYFGILNLRFIWDGSALLTTGLGFGIWNLLIAIAISGGFFAIQYFISRGRWIGGGDIRLGILMGLILGWPKILVALFIAYVGGAVICLPLLILKKKTLQSAIPFGVFLIPATLAAMFWGQKMAEWYLKF